MVVEVTVCMLNEIASVAVAHSNSWHTARRTILSHRQQRPTPQPRPPSRHGLLRKTDNMAETTNAATFKAVQIDALVRATSFITKTPLAAPLLFSSRRCVELLRLFGEKADSGL